MSEKILVPVLGESITEATVSKWLKNEGDLVEADEPIVELETDKVNLEVPSPISGTLIKIDSKNQTAYSKNLAKFTANIEQKMIDWQRQLKTIKTAQFLTYHGVWSYFFDAFGFTRKQQDLYHKKIASRCIL